MPALKTLPPEDYQAAYRSALASAGGVAVTGHSITQLFSARDPASGKEVGGVSARDLHPEIEPGWLVLCRYGGEGRAILRVSEDLSLVPLFGTLEPLEEETEAH